jgi:hypothetical protein
VGLTAQVGDVLVELALPGRPLPVEVVHLVAEPVEALHHLGLVDHAGGVRRARARPQQTDQAAEGQPDREGDEERQRVHAMSLNQTTDIATAPRRHLVDNPSGTIGSR